MKNFTKVMIVACMPVLIGCAENQGYTSAYQNTTGYTQTYQSNLRSGYRQDHKKKHQQNKNSGYSSSQSQSQQNQHSNSSPSANDGYSSSKISSQTPVSTPQPTTLVQSEGVKSTNVVLADNTNYASSTASEIVSEANNPIPVAQESSSMQSTAETVSAASPTPLTSVTSTPDEVAVTPVEDKSQP